MSASGKVNFSFTKLVVGDLDRCAAFYEKVVGLEPAMRFETEIAGRGLAEIIYKPTSSAAGTFVLLAYTDTPQPVLGEIIVGLGTTDLEGFIERAVAAGGSVAEPIRTEPSFKIRVAFVKDPEGHLLEVVQPL